VIRASWVSTYSFGSEVVLACDHLHIEESKLRMDSRELIHDGADVLVFLQSCQSSPIRQPKSQTSRINSPITYLYGKYSSRRLTWAARISIIKHYILYAPICPVAVNDDGDSPASSSGKMASKMSAVQSAILTVSMHTYKRPNDHN
jgi:hypothetical protein